MAKTSITNHETNAFSRPIYVLDSSDFVLNCKLSVDGYFTNLIQLQICEMLRDCFGFNIDIETGITETTMEPTRYTLTEHFCFYDAPGCFTENMEMGVEGKTYVQELSM